MFASIVLLPLYLQLVKGYSPAEAGLLTLPQAAGTLASSVIAGQFTSRTGRYKEPAATRSLRTTIATPSATPAEPARR
jgi:hypothetical protein